MGSNPTLSAKTQGLTTELLALKEWAQARQRELVKLRDQGNVPGDVTQLNVVQLVREYLEDPETKRLNTYPDVTRLCAEWVISEATRKHCSSATCCCFARPARVC